MSRLKGKSFKILAVSLDDERNELVGKIAKRKVPGLHTWDPKGWEGNSVRRLYNVHNIPAWYLIDAEGVIRGRDMFGDALVPAIEKALKQARP